jgi:hypothetical protein
MPYTDIGKAIHSWRTSSLWIQYSYFSSLTRLDWCIIVLHDRIMLRDKKKSDGGWKRGMKLIMTGLFHEILSTSPVTQRRILSKSKGSIRMWAKYSWPILRQYPGYVWRS